MRYVKSFKVLTALVIGATLVFWQIALAQPPALPGNPGLPGCLAEVAAKDAVIAELQAEIDELNELLEQLQGQALVQKTGQTTSYATGDDGDLQRGISWPVPRFTVHEDGTVTDNMTGLMFIQDANCIGTNYPDFDTDGTAGDGRVTWQHALDFVAGINDGTYPLCGAGYTDWRLANLRELHSLLHYGYSNPALSDTTGTMQWTDGDPFFNVEQSYEQWWTSTSLVGSANAWYVNVRYGILLRENKSDDRHVWYLRGGE